MRPARYPPGENPCPVSILENLDPRHRHGPGLLLQDFPGPGQDPSLPGHALENENLSQRTRRKKILTACPNCHLVFKTDGAPLEAVSVYAVLAEHGPPPGQPAADQTVTIHDPCTARHEPAIQEAVRALARSKGLHLREMPHSGRKTICCGKGGAVEFMDPTLPAAWNNRRIFEAAGRSVLTPCAGCTQALNKKAPVFHLLDLLFDPGCIVAGKISQARWPMTSLNRIRLKHRIKKQESPLVFCERPTDR